MVAPQDNFRTAAGPMKEWFDLARELESDPRVIKISLFPMQPWLDVQEAGWTAVVYTDNDPSLARQLSARLADKAWELREQFWKFERVAPEELLRQVAEASEGPILVSDIADTVLGGAPGDSTCLLHALLKQNYSFPVLLPMYDPEVVDRAFSVGEGNSLTTFLGGKRDNVFSKPVEVTGTVAALTEGMCIDIKERPYRRIKRGRTVILQVGSISLLVGEDRGIGGVHPDVYRYFGFEPENAKMIVVKTGGNFQYFTPICKDLILADCPGMGQSDLRNFTWNRAPRPLYPIDSLEKWKAE
jgi:microcystin degradation protein MlrC